MRVVHFLIHIPRCAGTTVERHFQAHLPAEFMIARRWENPLRHLIGNRYPALGGDALSRVSVVSGHSLSAGLGARLPDATIRQSVLLRDPLTRLVSLYNMRWTRFDQGVGTKPPSFERWYRAQRLNSMSRFLLTRYFEQGIPAIYRWSSAERLRFIEERLGGFWFVGAYRMVGQLVARISRERGLPETACPLGRTETPRVTPDSLPERLVRRIRADNRLDQVLYDRWAMRGWTQTTLPPPPPLPRGDQGQYLLSDAYSGIVKSVVA